MSNSNVWIVDVVKKNEAITESIYWCGRDYTKRGRHYSWSSAEIIQDITKTELVGWV